MLSGPDHGGSGARGIGWVGGPFKKIFRTLQKKVTDFFDFTLVDFPVFNIADTAIVIGVGILSLWILFGPQEELPIAESGEPTEPECPAGVNDPNCESSPRTPVESARIDAEHTLSKDA